MSGTDALRRGQSGDEETEQARRTNERQAEGATAFSGSKPPEQTRVPSDLQREADRLLVRYAPAAVVVNDQLEIIQTKGHTGCFLELPPGKATLNLLKMSRPGLLYELQNAIDEARKSGNVVTRANVPAEGHDGITMATMHVTPFKTPVQDRFSFLIAFEPPTGATATAQSAEPVTAPFTDDERMIKDKQIAQLKQELAATKQYLQSTIEAHESANEELQLVNEEIQSGNEELQSTNEELQTSREDLESAIEQLHTANEEMQRRNELLTQLNNDVVNLLNSVNLPMVMVGPDLSVRRFTPEAVKLLGLTPSDIGRPITRVKLNIEVPNFEQMLLDVMSGVRPIQHSVRHLDGAKRDLRLTPYSTADNRIDGVVLSILTFDELDGPATSARSGSRKGSNTRPHAMKKGAAGNSREK